MYQNLASQPQAVPQPQIPQPQQQQMMNGPVDQQKRNRYKDTIYNLGMTEVILGAISCVLCVATLIGASVGRYSYRYSGITYVSQGLWCGAFLIASGILGLRARSNPSRCMYNANMGVAITTSVFMGVLVIMSSIAAILSTVFVMICHIILALLGFTGLIITIVHAAYCCAGVCCISSQYRGPVVYGHQQPMQPMMQVQLANGQYMMVPYQPVMQPNVQPMQAPVATPVVPAQMPTAQPIVQPAQVPYPAPAAVPNLAPPTAPQDPSKPPEYSAYPHQQI